jgi:hypothetical protein
VSSYSARSPPRRSGTRCILKAKARSQDIIWVKGQGQNQNQVAFKLWVNRIRLVQPRHGAVRGVLRAVGDDRGVENGDGDGE